MLSGFLNAGLAVPAGAVQAFAGNSAPKGWLPCDGSAISRTQYKKLFAFIGETYGVGDGATTFNLPDLRGEFIRGHDGGRNVDTGRIFGSNQTDGFKSHDHSAFTAATIAGSFATNTGTAVTDTARGAGLTQLPAEGINETRPRNVALMYCIKF